MDKNKIKLSSSLYLSSYAGSSRGLTSPELMQQNFMMTAVAAAARKRVTKIATISHVRHLLASSSLQLKVSVIYKINQSLVLLLMLLYFISFITYKIMET